ncbi:MAG: hypothetical protein ACI9MC_001832 [Kiritimatiellia bacterium]|jgi:hypothetical protein
MSEETGEETTTTDGIETEEAESQPKVRDQIPAHIPPAMRHMFTKHEGSFAAKPGFRNASNTKSMAQRKKRKKR